MNTCEVLIRESMATLKIRTMKDLAGRLGMVRQTLAYRLKYPQTFVGSEINAMVKLFNWSDEQITRFVRGMNLE